MSSNSRSYEDLPDDSLIGLARRGDESASAELIDRHLAPVRGFVAFRLPIDHVIDEIAHETFVFAFTHLEAFTPGGSFRAWLRAIAHNLVRREVLRFARERKNLSNFEHAQISDLDERIGNEGERDEVVFLEQCLERLPEATRRLIDDRYRQDLSGAEIAERWGRSEEWVRVTLLRARRQLRDCIERKMKGELHAI